LSIIVIITLTASINRSLVGLIMQPVKSDFGLTASSDDRSDLRLVTRHSGLWSC
jgi:hypothetical protein